MLKDWNLLDLQVNGMAHESVSVTRERVLRLCGYKQWVYSY